jgi:hypothetical protein
VGAQTEIALDDRKAATVSLETGEISTQARKLHLRGSETSLQLAAVTGKN